MIGVTKVGLYDCGKTPARLVATYALDEAAMVRVAVLDPKFPTSISCMGMDGSGFRSIRTREQVFPSEGSKFLAALVDLSANTSYVKWVDMS